ncbi:MAG: transferase [Peptococcaceae bacterium BICA1-8]|nr:MAG: transferase [Peptococcaceae bacterium BICA1-8]
MKDIVIIGAGGFGREVAWLIEEINAIEQQWDLLGFIDDNLEIQGEKINGYKVIGTIEWLKSQSLNVIVAIGDPLAKKNALDILIDSKNSYPVLIHPSVIKSELVELGEGCIVCAGNIMTVNIQLGRHVIVNLDCTIGHDAILGDYTTILPSVNISGYVEIEECVSVGTGTAIIQGIKIGKNAVIGAGAVVVKNLPDNCVAVGSPARPIKYINE